jgi:phosphate transport system permease protein
MVWLCGGSLALSLLLVSGLLVLLAVKGLGYFWPGPVIRFTLTDGRVLLGEVSQVRVVPPPRSSPGAREKVQTQVRVGNRDLTGIDFVWIDDEASIASRETPPGAVVLERLEYGNFYGSIVEVKRGGETIVKGADAAWDEFQRLHGRERAALDRILEFEHDRLGPVNQELDRLRIEKKRVKREGFSDTEKRTRILEIERLESECIAESHQLAEQLSAMRQEATSNVIVLEAVNGERKDLPISSVVRAVKPNALGFFGALGVYASRVWEFVADDPRESNTEGGIFPAIFGTVLMVFLMSIAVVPLGVLAALYLREYAKPGPLVRAVRIAVNNLAGVPSIVFGVFGLGFFVYGVGGSIDRLFYSDALPTPTFGTGGILWAALTLALLTVPVVIVATEEGLAAVPRIVREGSRAMGATKFETTWRVVVPAAAPGILTGLILSMARAAGEVAPLMIVGMVKLAPALPIDGTFPFLHFERKFMHLGFHVYDVGFQSPNVDATKPLVFATAFLLIVLITAMNLAAIALRNNLRRKYAGSAV